MNGLLDWIILRLSSRLATMLSMRLQAKVKCIGILVTEKSLDQAFSTGEGVCLAIQIGEVGDVRLFPRLIQPQHFQAATQDLSRCANVTGRESLRRQAALN